MRLNKIAVRIIQKNIPKEKKNISTYSLTNPTPETDTRRLPCNGDKPRRIRVHYLNVFIEPIGNNIECDKGLKSYAKAKKS